MFTNALSAELLDRPTTMSLSDDGNAQDVNMDAAFDPVLGETDDGAEEETRDATVEDLFGDEEDDEPAREEAPAADTDGDVGVAERQSSATPSLRGSDGDGLTEAERKHRKAMEYEEEEGEGEHAEPQILREAEINIPKLPLPTSSDSQYWMMRMPNFLKLDTKPFHQETYEGPQDEYEGEERKESATMLDVTNTIRWRWVQGENGEMKKQSNARIVRWSDGSMSLQLGTEIFDVNANVESARPAAAAAASQSQSQTQPQIKRSGGLSYLYTQHKHAGVLQCEVPITGTLTLQPTGMFSATHRQLVRAVGQRHTRTARLRLAPEPTMDPEREQRELQKTANRTARPRKPRATGGGGGFDGGGARRSRMSTASRRRDYAFGSDESGGEVGSDSDDGGRRKAPTSAKRGGEYVADDFVVSDEDDADEGGSPTGKRRKDTGMDSLDEADEKIEREQAKRRKKEKEADEDEDVDMEDSAEEEEEASIRKTGGKTRSRRRAVALDDEEDE